MSQKEVFKEALKKFWVDQQPKKAPKAAPTAPDALEKQSE
jgi:hypothetical protein